MELKTETVCFNNKQSTELLLTGTIRESYKQCSVQNVTNVW
jgi:hypothetical protein